MDTATGLIGACPDWRSRIERSATASMEFTLSSSKGPVHRALPDPRRPPGSEQPLPPIDPASALLGPLALLALAYGRKKSRGRWDTLVILLALGVSVGMSLAACGGPTTTTIDTPTVTATATVTPSPTGTVAAAITVTPKAPESNDSPSPTIAQMAWGNVPTLAPARQVQVRFA